MRWRERCHRRPGAASGARATSWRGSTHPDLRGSPPPPPRCRQPAWRCTGSRGTGPAPAGRRWCAAVGGVVHPPGRAGLWARSPAAAEAGTGPAPRAPAACDPPHRAVGAFRPPGGCNTLLPVASAGGNRKVQRSDKVRGDHSHPTGPCGAAKADQSQPRATLTTNESVKEEEPGQRRVDRPQTGIP